LDFGIEFLEALVDLVQFIASLLGLLDDLAVEVIEFVAFLPSAQIGELFDLA
jgi:hypothetical protein